MKFLLNLDKKKIPGIKSIRRLPPEKDQYSNYGPMIFMKYFLDDGKGPKMIAIATKSASMTPPVLLIMYDLKLRPALTIELKPDAAEEKILEFIGEFITKSKFKVPKPSSYREQSEEYKRRKLLEGGSLEAAIGVAIAIFSGIMTVVSVMLLLQGIGTKASHAAEEHYVNTKIEQELNKELFESQQKKESGFEMFSKVEQYLDFILNKKANALILCGPPGMSKTYMVRRTLYFNNKTPGKDYVIEKGSALGLASTYSLLYENKDRLLVLDDFDTPLKDPEIVNLLKAITDTYGKRIVSLATEKVKGQAALDAVSSAPRKFEFRGQVIIITNLKISDLDLALISRAPAMEVNYNTKQVINATEKLLKYMSPKVPMKLKQEVYNYIVKLYRFDKKINVNFRSIKSSIDARVGNPQGWKDMVNIIIGYTGGNIRESKKVPYVNVLKENVASKL